MLCTRETVLDDVVVTLLSGLCVCLRCFERETQTAKPPPLPDMQRAANEAP
jgi:hypothetical protein